MRSVTALIIPFVLSTTWSISVWSQTMYQQMADIEFLESPYFIAILTHDESSVLKVSFKLMTNDHQREAAISPCIYEERALKAQVMKIEDPAVRSAFNWIFLRGDRSPVSLEQFYPHFKALLERTAPTCPVPSLEELRVRLQRSKG